MIKTSISPKEMGEIVRYCSRMPNAPTIFVWGQPGIGKTEIVRQVAEQEGLDLRVVTLALMDPTELKGFIFPNMEKQMAELLPWNFLPEEPGILFLDEFNTAPPAVLNVAMRLVNERMVGELRVPSRVMIVCAGNRMTDKVSVSRLSAAMVNKVIHVNVEASVDDFKDWALGKGLSPLVLGYLESFPSHLCGEPRTDSPYPTPRAWEKVSQVLETALSLHLKQALVAGLVGDEIALKFMEFVRNADVADLIKAVIERGENVYPQSDEPAKSYTLSVSLAQRASQNHALINRVMEYLCQAPSYFSPFAIAAVKNLLRTVDYAVIYREAQQWITPFVQHYQDVFKKF